MPFCVEAASSSLLSAAHSTVAIDWDTESKKLCYDEQEAEVSGLMFITQSCDRMCKQSVYLCVNI